MTERLAPLHVLRQFVPHDDTLPGLLDARERRDPMAPLLIFRDEVWTRERFGHDTRRLAAALAARGIATGDRVAVLAGNHAHTVLLLFALARLNAVMVPSNPAGTAADLRYVLERADVKAVAATEQTLDNLHEALSGSTLATPWIFSLAGRIADLDGVDDLMQQPLSCALPQPAPQATCLIIFTSGTTGFPKGVMHSQRNVVLAGEANVARLWLQPRDRVLTLMPLFHTNALFYSLAGTVAAGACMVLLERFSASTFWDTAVQTGATTVNFIEAIGRILKSRPRSEYRPQHGIEVVYGARPDIHDCFRDEFHIPHLISGFGMTEIPGVCCVPWEGPRLVGSMGPMGRHPDPAMPWAEGRVVDEAGQDVPDGVVGEFWVKHPIVMQGYFGDPEQTAAAFHGEWFKTGDLVRRDASGCYWFVTRKKDIIRRRGENISGAELDRAIAAHPAVFEVAAVPVPSDLGEDEILVCVVLRPGHTLDPAALHAWCRERLAAIKVPRYIALLPELPHTPTHKVAKQTLKDRGPELLARAIDFAIEAPAGQPPHHVSAARGA